MRFAISTTAIRTPGIVPLVSAALVPAAVVLVLACSSIYRAEVKARLPASILAWPPAAAESPIISVQLSRDGAMTIGGQIVSAENLAAVWQRERAAVSVLGFTPGQATVAIHAEPDTPTDLVQQVIEQAQQAGFERSILK
jgi:biopolymer transport protein ExbD